MEMDIVKEMESKALHNTCLTLHTSFYSYYPDLY